MATENAFSKLAEDLVLTIFFKLEEDPRDWARVACVCTKFSSLVRTVCWRSKCSSTIPSVVSDLLSSSAAAGAPLPQVSWASLHKLAVCCPGLIHAGVLLENSDFGLERELGPDESFRRSDRRPRDSSSSDLDLNNNDSEEAPPAAPAPGSICSWSLFDDLYNDTLYSAVPETLTNDDDDDTQMGEEGGGEAAEKGAVKVGHAVSDCKRRRNCRSLRSHLASGAWNLCREQGNKLLASRFRGDCLYICDWPGCIHIEEKRNYMLFRGIFKNFKGSRVWRTINDRNRSKIDLNCAFCACKETWDLHSAFCLKRVFGFHDDGEPVVRAYVCENGHVSGAWTDRPLYT